MTDSADLGSRVEELEREVARLRAERAESAPDGAMLKALLDDIERRRMVEEDLRDHQQWLDLAQRAGSVAAYAFDLQTETLDWSPSTLELYGLDEGTKPTLETWLGSIHPDDLPTARRVAAAAIDDGVDIDHRFRIVRPDGSVRWVQDRGHVLPGNGGGCGRIVGVNIDITEIVELQTALASESDRLKIALQAGRLSCWDWTLATNEVVWDESLSRYAGQDDFGGSFDAFWELVHEEDKPAISAALDAALAGEADYAVEFRMWRPDGTVRWTSTHANVVRDTDGKPVRMVGIDADISDRKAAEFELRSNEQFLGAVLDVSTDCVKVLDLDGTLSYMNPNGLCALELDSFSAVSGQNWSCLWPDDTAPLIEEAVARARLGLKTRFESFCPTAKGTPRWWDVAVAPMRNAENKVVRIVSLSRDISDRREKEEQVALLNRELHHRVKNTVATVQAIARSTAQGEPSLAEFNQRFDARLLALAHTHDLLFEGGDSTTVSQLLTTELAPFNGGTSGVELDGPEITVESAEALALGMIFHELTTNAVKYGGLSPIGHGLEVRWSTSGEHPLRRVHIEWIERSEKVKINDKQTGFGTKLIERLVRGSMRGTLERHFGDDGGRVLIQFPLR